MMHPLPARVGSSRASIRISVTLVAPERADCSGPNIEAGPCAAEVAMVGPPTVTTHLVCWIKAAVAQQD